MTLNASGTISLAGNTTGESIALELSQSATGLISLNDSNVRGLASVPSGVITMPNDFWGKQNAFVATISSNQTNLDLRTWALANGWDGTAYAIITIGSGVYIYSNSTGSPALTISGSWPNGVKVINLGYVMGKGGEPIAYGVGSSGGDAVSLGISCEIDNTNSSAYIGGGGGGGGGGDLTYPYLGGGGAGGGRGNPSVGSVGANGTAGLYGAGGGRIFPGTGGAGASGDAAGFGGGAGGGGTAYGRQVPSGSTHQTFIGCNCCYTTTYTGAGNYGGGGGGWGASGGAAKIGTVATNGSSGAGGAANNAGANASVSGGYFVSGGAGGKAVALNGYSVTWTSSNTTRVYGAVS